MTMNFNSFYNWTRGQDKTAVDAPNSVKDREEQNISSLASPSQAHNC